MVPTLPTPGSDTNVWGDELNEFLSVSLDAAGKIRDRISVKDYGALGDGVTNDTAAIASAIAALPATGGTVFFPPGTYLASVSLTANKRIKLYGPGATIKPPASSVGIDVDAVAGSTALGHDISGLRIDGSNGGVTGIRVTNTDRVSLRDFRIENCVTGIELKSDASEWVEGTYLANGFIISCTTGLWFHKTATGSGSFGETVAISVGVNDCTTGVQLDSGATIYRSLLTGLSVWINNNQTGLKIEGGVYGASLQGGIETLDTGTGTVGINVTATASNPALASFQFIFTGPIATKVQVAGGQVFRWQEGGTQEFYASGFGGARYWKLGDTWPRVTVDVDAVGGLSFGGGAGAADVSLYRLQADVLETPDQLVVAGGITTKTKAGAPSDSDTALDQDGSIILDTTNNRLYVRSGGVWKYAALT